MHVRMATEADVSAIINICAGAYPRTYANLLSQTAIEEITADFYNPDRVLREIAPAPPHWSGYMVVEDDQGRIAAAGGGDLPSETKAHLYVLYADPDRRGQGFGTAILDFLTRQQVAAGAREQWVSAMKGNDKAIPFYRARGFEVMEETVPWDKVLAREGAVTLQMRRKIGSSPDLP